MSGNRFLCLHAHFYQPPRENPWLEEIGHQESAHPYHDWNARISAECYHPNGLSRILDEKGWVEAFVNNYARISFNFGPTLLFWLEDHDPIAYQAILDGDRQGRKKFNGHGPAIAQAYNHVILPLSNIRDKVTQVNWGLRDFEKRFGRDAEAMWLPETAVDMQTLEILADHGMRYVILAPRQAKAVRSLKKDGPWENVQNENINPRKPYLVNLPNGKSITAFFYDGMLSKAVAFEGVLHNGEEFAERLMDGYVEGGQPQLLHIATDGESYGHHHRHGDMALAYALDHLERHKLAELTVYGDYLDNHSPEDEVRIFENSSWSCVHGIERWRKNCGCNSGMSPADWNQKWRAPLREAFDFLRDSLQKPYEDFMSGYTQSPWDMRDDYIRVILNRDADNRAAFLEKWTGNADHPEQEKIFKALEIQRNLQLVYTSCAWFFDEVSGIETVQNMQYACRVIELAGDVLGLDLEDDFLKRLDKADSNIQEYGSAKAVYEQLARPAMLGPLKVAAHLGAILAFEKEENHEGRFYCFDYKMNDFQRYRFGKVQLLCADVEIISRITQESQQVDFCVIHLGDHNIDIGVRPHTDDESYEAFVQECADAFNAGALTNSVRLMDTHFPDTIYSLKDLFKDQQKKIIGEVLDNSLDYAEGEFVNIYEQHFPVMRYLSQINISLPPIFRHIARYVLNSRIEQELGKNIIKAKTIQKHISRAIEWNVEFDEENIEKTYQAAFDRLINKCEDAPDNLKAMKRLYNLLKTIEHLPFEIKIGEMQNEFYQWYERHKNKDFAKNEEWKNLVLQTADILTTHLDIERMEDYEAP